MCLHYGFRCFCGTTWHSIKEQCPQRCEVTRNDRIMFEDICGTHDEELRERKYQDWQEAARLRYGTNDCYGCYSKLRCGHSVAMADINHSRSCHRAVEGAPCRELRVQHQQLPYRCTECRTQKPLCAEVTRHFTCGHSTTQHVMVNGTCFCGDGQPDEIEHFLETSVCANCAGTEGQLTIGLGV